MLALLSLTLSLQAQSQFTFNSQYINVQPKTGTSALPSYLMKFGTFSIGFTPTPQNLSLWDANFTGFSGTYLPSVSGFTQNVIKFSLTTNTLIPINSQLYLVLYDVAPNANPSLASNGVIVTQDNWLMGEARKSGTRWINYNYSVGGRVSGTGNYDEDNIPPVSNIAAFSSPVNTLLLGGSTSLDTSFAMVPEPSTYALVILSTAALGAYLWRKRRHTGD